MTKLTLFILIIVGTPDASSTGPTVKPTDASVQKSTPGLPKAPQSNAVPSGSSSTGATGPATPVKGSTIKIVLFEI